MALLPAVLFDAGGQTRCGTDVLCADGHFRAPWNQDAIRIQAEILRDESDLVKSPADLTLITATRLVQQRQLFIDAVIKQAERDGRHTTPLATSPAR